MANTELPTGATLLDLTRRMFHDRTGPLALAIVAMLAMAGVVRMSSWPSLLQSELPHQHSPVFDSLYLLLEPTVLLILTIVPTFMMLIGTSSADLSAGSWASLRNRLVLALVLSAASLVVLVGVENLLKKGLARARPVARTEHFIIAAALDGTLPPSIASQLRPELFECPIGRNMFVNGQISREHLKSSPIHDLSQKQKEEHIRSIEYREGIGPQTFDAEEQFAELLEMAAWRPKHLQPVLERLLNPRKVCDLTGSAPSGHVLRQGFVFFLFCSVVFSGGFERRGMAIPLALFASFQVATLSVAAWSRIYGFDHTWSDEVISFALTAGVLAFGRVVPMVVIEEGRRSLTGMLAATQHVSATMLSTVRDLRPLTETLRNELNCDHVSIRMFDSESNTFTKGFSTGGETESTMTSVGLSDSKLREWLNLPDVTIESAKMGAGSVMVTPLAAGGRNEGLMWATYRGELRPNTKWQNRMRLFAGLVAVAVSRSRLSEELERQGASLSKRLSSVVDLDETLTVIVKFVAEALLTDRALLVLDDPKLNDLVVRAVTGWDSKVVGAMTLRKERGSLAGYTIEKKTPIHWHMGELVDFEVDRRCTEEGIKSMLGVPVKEYDEAGNWRVIGVLIAQSEDAARRFGELQVTLMESVARKTALALKSVSQFELLERRKAHFEALAKAAEIALTPEEHADHKELMERILRAAMTSVTRAQWGTNLIGELHSYDASADSLRLDALVTEPPNSRELLIHLFDSLWHPRDDEEAGNQIGIAGRAILDRTSIVEGDVSVHKDYDPRWYSPLKMRSKLTVPLREAGKIIGTICLQSDVFAAFDEGDKRTLKLWRIW